MNFEYQFEDTLIDRDPSSTVGSYEVFSPATLTLGTESYTSNFGYAIFAQPNSYDVAIAFPNNPAYYAYFQGRVLRAAYFNFYNFSDSLLVSDDLPTSPSFALNADRTSATFVFQSVPGDPSYGVDQYTNFALIQNDFYAPLRLSAVPEPVSIAIWGVFAICGCLVLFRSKISPNLDVRK